jgi:hypothetical protein
MSEKKESLPPVPMLNVLGTWREMLPVLLILQVEGTSEGKVKSRAELDRMADLADGMIEERMLVAHLGSALIKAVKYIEDHCKDPTNPILSDLRAVMDRVRK